MNYNFKKMELSETGLFSDTSPEFVFKEWGKEKNSKITRLPKRGAKKYSTAQKTARPFKLLSTSKRTT
jgi:hypothetical protein